MNTVAFDTLKYVKQLEASGVSPAQAEAWVYAQRDILADALGATLATKTDIAELRAATKTDIAELRAATKTDIAELRAATKDDIAELRVMTKADIAELRVATKTDIAAVKAEISTIRWMMGVLIALAVANFAKQFF